jgi:hypothetical protein
MSEGVTVEGIEQLNNFLNRISGPALLRVMQRAALVIGEQLKERLQVTPGRPNYPLRWASKKQRAWYFAMRAAQSLPIKYTRISDPQSQKLEQSWSVVRRGLDGAIVGNRALYAPWVQSKERQTEMHADTGWKTDAQAVEEIERQGVIGKAIVASLKGALTGFQL